jgi:hypothetical protein
VQTFLPYEDFDAVARVLDPRRLGKQRVEAVQVLRGLTVAGYGWRRHPAVRMWAGYEEALVRYGLEMCRVWSAAGRADTCAETLLRDLPARARASRDLYVRSEPELARDGDLPPWLGDPAFHLSHRSALVTRAPEHYRRYFPDVPTGLPYVWPSSDREPSL